MDKTYNQYIADVESGREVACLFVRQSVGRHASDLKKVDDPDFPYYFDEEKANRAIDFIGFCKHVKGDLKGQYIHLDVSNGVKLQ